MVVISYISVEKVLLHHHIGGVTTPINKAKLKYQLKFKFHTVKFVNLLN